MDQATLLKLLQFLNLAVELAPKIRAYVETVQATTAADLTSDDALDQEINATLMRNAELLAAINKVG